MLLAVDVGNTQTVFGLFDGERLTEHWRVATEPRRTGDELGVTLSRLPRPRRRRRASASRRPCRRSSARTRSSPSAGRARRSSCSAPGTTTGHPDPLRRPARGRARPDRERGRGDASATAAPCIVVDFGTSTNFDVVSAAGEYVGGVLAPGIEISMDALFARAARLTKVDFVEPPTVIGKTTTAALQSGLVYGFAGQVDGIVERIRGELGAEAHGDRDRRARRR